MQLIQSGYRSLSVLYDLGFDRVIVPIVIAAGLALSAYLATKASVLTVPVDYFF
ncbi:hypothetical protein OEW28_15720 [Defluviimonas sp. WL0002]|uniref:Uncharacterized protein n=1 Tax=Albidovulum marisflavi TaxID=2984159 RepID=A0ABT2ZG51_9RHOB|nr:hypothetical protein [Defluviimonas sp. WL0002]MCV2870079.1 hypothetical protein [Defluviimonas sp. WL0002]